MKLDNFKKDLIIYLNQKCPKIEVHLVGEPEYNKGFMLQIDEKSTDSAEFYEVKLVKYINNEEINQAKKDKEDLNVSGSFIKKLPPKKEVNPKDTENKKQ